MLYNSKGYAPANAVWASGTYTASSPPCTLALSSALGGVLAINDARGGLVFFRPSSAGLALTPPAAPPPALPSCPVSHHLADHDPNRSCIR